METAVRDFLNNRDPREYVKALDDLLSVYLPSDEFAMLKTCRRRDIHDAIVEIKTLIVKLIEINDA